MPWWARARRPLRKRSTATADENSQTVGNDGDFDMGIYTLKDGQHLGLAHLPRRKLPEGTFLVHNHVVPAKPLNMNGFRAWVQKGDVVNLIAVSDLVECGCDFGGNANADKNTHYRVRH
jgi:hypothetical protein